MPCRLTTTTTAARTFLMCTQTFQQQQEAAQSDTIMFLLVWNFAWVTHSLRLCRPYRDNVISEQHMNNHMNMCAYTKFRLVHLTHTEMRH